MVITPQNLHETVMANSTRHRLWQRIVAVLAKSSGHVYLRDKQPNLTAIQPGRRVVVLIPPQGSAP